MPIALIISITITAYVVVQVIINLQNTKADTLFTLSNSILLLSTLAIIAFNSESSRYTDFLRMKLEMQDSLEFGTRYIVNLYSINPLSGIILRIIAITGVFNLLKALAALVYYGSALFIANQFLRAGANNWSVLLATAVVLYFQDFSYTTVDNIRFFPASALLIATIINCEIIHDGKNRLRALFICICCALIHVALWIPVLMYVISVVKKKWFQELFGVLSLLSFPILQFIVNRVGSSNADLAWKADLYLNPDSEYYSALASNKQIAFYVVTLFCLAALRYYSRKEKNIVKISCQYNVFVTFIFFFCIGSIPSNVTFVRYVPFFLLCNFPIIVNSFSSYFDFSNDRVGNEAKSSTFGVVKHFLFLGTICFILLCIALRSLYSYSTFYVSF